MVSEDSGQVSPVADPGLADQARRRLARQAGKPAGGAAAAAGCGGLVVSIAGLTAAVVLHFAAGLSWWWAGGGVLAAAAVLDSQQRAVTLARDATEARAGALESYAVQVQAADAAQQDWLSALRLSALNGQYLDLVARTAAGEHALAEITG